jgi:3',5'-cyclic AMP phosphodiesterase CpdA
MHAMLRRVGFGSSLLAFVVACTSSEDPPPPEKSRYRATVYAPLTDAPTTVERTLVARMPRANPDNGPNPALPDALLDYLAKGFGELDVGPGDAYVTRVIDEAERPPPPGPNAKRLVRFAHLADLQLADDESPTRLGRFDGSGATSSALRPQDAYLCHMANAAVRTINALHAKDPIAFTLMGGDNADSAQTNEVEWVLDILSGADSVECDSGDDDDIVEGPDNDGKDPFKADGLQMPWKWVTGNHDVLVQGNFPVDEEQRNRVLDIVASGGTRRYDGALKGAVEHGEFVVKDPRRALLSGHELMVKVGGHGDGHGIGPAEIESGRATYTFDVDGTPLRFVVLDTAHPNGASEGVITQGEIHRVIKPLLDKAKADGKWVVLSSHHAVSSLSDGTGLGGTKAPDALTAEDWKSFVGQYDNVLFSMVGHSHRHRVEAVKPASGHPWWEIMTSAIADYPHQFRIVEIFDQDNGWVMLRATAVDFSTEGDSVAMDGKKRGIVDFTSGWLPVDDVTADHKNVEVWIKKP